MYLRDLLLLSVLSRTLQKLGRFQGEGAVQVQNLLHTLKTPL